MALSAVEGAMFGDLAFMFQSAHDFLGLYGYPHVNGGCEQALAGQSHDCSQAITFARKRKLLKPRLGWPVERKLSMHDLLSFHACSDWITMNYLTNCASALPRQAFFRPEASASMSTFPKFHCQNLLNASWTAFSRILRLECGCAFQLTWEP